MVKVRKYCLLVFSLMIISCVSTQSEKSAKINGITLYQSLGGVSTKMQRELDKQNIELIYLINGAYIDGKKDYQIDRKGLRKRLDGVLPDRNTRKLIVLDIEGIYMKDLSKPNEKNFNKALNFYIEVYDFVKGLRPKATIGFYGLPWRYYYNRDDKWRRKNETLEPLLRRVDALFPSIYDFYVFGEDRVSVSGEHAYVRDNAVEGIRIGKMYGKPVYPFVWHRYHPSNTHRPNEYIEQTEFYGHIKEIATSTYEGSHVDGIIWWSSERYYFNGTELAKRSKNRDDDFNRSIDRDLLPYLKLFTKALLDAKD